MVSASPAHVRINSFEHAGFLHILAREVTPVYNWIYATFLRNFLFTLLYSYWTPHDQGAVPVCASDVIGTPHPCVYRRVKVVCTEKPKMMRNSKSLVRSAQMSHFWVRKWVPEIPSPHIIVVAAAVVVGSSSHHHRHHHHQHQPQH